MYKRIFRPTENEPTIAIPIPREWQGKFVEIVAMPVTPSPKEKSISDEEFFKLCGAWESDQSADEMVAELKAARTFREKDIEF
jgi:hypothetical protein